MMTPENFCYWLQGVIELTDPKEFNEEQVKLIKEHLQLVFDKQTGPNYVNLPNFLEPLPDTVDHFKTEITCSTPKIYPSCSGFVWGT